VIDLCVVNYNTRPLLQRLVDELHKGVDSSNKNWKLYIADNDSSDDTIQWIRENDSNYSIDRIFLNKNIGYSAACNQLAAHGTGDIIALLNSDVWFTNEDINAVQKIFDDNTDIHILGPKQRDEYGLIRHAGIIGSNTQPKHRGWNQADQKDELYKDRVPCVTVSGSAYFIRRSVWDALTNDEEYRKMYPEAIGAFLPTPHYYEETWCSYFARHRGYNVVYDGSVSIGHSWHASSPKPGEGYSHADAQFKTSQSIFRKACDTIGIERD
jgi:GT2 family glycosyltransferase